MQSTLQLNRCAWVSDDAQYQHYHDHEWGRPETASQALFAKLCLDGQQAGLSWITILRKQANYEAAFHNFVPQKIVTMDEQGLEALMHNPGIIRNRLKIRAIVANARAYMAIEEKQSFSDYLWQFTDGKTIINRWNDLSLVPVSTPESTRMAKTLKKDGFKFVGETICYAFMQAVGMVNDHTTDCHCYDEICTLARR
ncbi:DNA-3-methyladenine glycosylase I [Alteromonas aestuariivivens]|uniref:DNA-3-methyladenine glycosylase I n=1 Tax=Alteromonas aestuariivivens TaxID=1938339 RepID=A0A3D8M4W1_9ALTE|nr:DNA-3-methyladenine glycosylase I [Alteromonas aestuariivivens]RDV24773.1 DNA-3-methyladenine glycosylase I [Alteromonas aestuariivivens]